jgi:putative redox protein
VAGLLGDLRVAQAGDDRRQQRHARTLVSEDAPPIHAELVWAGGLKFGATSGSTAIAIDSDGEAGPSPVQLLAEAVAGCMAIDLVLILTKGRHPLQALRITFTGERAPTPPRRFTRIDLTFHVTGDVPAAAVERALALSRDTYCSVWHSLRQDIAFTTNYQIHQ